MDSQWAKILAGRVSVADFVFAKEVRLGTYSGKPGAVAPPAAIVAAHAMALDPRAEPRFGERIPYVVVHGPPGEPGSASPACTSQAGACDQPLLSIEPQWQRPTAPLRGQGGLACITACTPASHIQ